MYIERSVLSRNPFECLDTLGVGQLVQLAVNNFKSKNPNIKVCLHYKFHLGIQHNLVIILCRSTLWASILAIPYRSAIWTRLALMRLLLWTSTIFLASCWLLRRQESSQIEVSYREKVFVWFVVLTLLILTCTYNLVRSVPPTSF